MVFRKTYEYLAHNIDGGINQNSSVPEKSTFYNKMQMIIIPHYDMHNFENVAEQMTEWYPHSPKVEIPIQMFYFWDIEHFLFIIEVNGYDSERKWRIRIYTSWHGMIYRKY